MGINNKAGTLALCIPAYNAGWCLPRLLESASKQSVPFDEIMVYDDCSTDDTAEVARKYGARVIAGDENVGCSTGKNRLAEASTSEWIHFHDADDELKHDFVKAAHEWISQGDSAPDVVLFSYDWIDHDTGELLNTRVFDNEALRTDPEAYTISEQINPFCGLYRRSSILAAGGYDVDPLVLYNEDDAFHMRLAREGLTFAADPRVTVVNYRIGGSMSQANYLKCAQAKYHVMRKAAQLSGSQYHRLIASQLWVVAGQLASQGDFKTASNALHLATDIGGRMPPESSGSTLFRSLAYISPILSLKLREQFIRRAKPYLRAG